MNMKMRTDAFAAFGSLSNYGVGAQREAFLEQVESNNILYSTSITPALYMCSI